MVLPFFRSAAMQRQPPDGRALGQGTSPLGSQLAERRDHDPALVASPARLGPELWIDVQFVGLGLIASDAARPTTDARVQQPVLDVLSNLPGDEGTSVGPFADPPAPLRHHVFEYVDYVGRIQPARGEVVQHAGASIEQRIGAYAPMVPAARTPLAH